MMSTLLRYLVTAAACLSALSCASDESNGSRPKDKLDFRYLIKVERPLKPGEKAGGWGSLPTLSGYIDRTGKVVIKPQFEDAGQFVDGRAVVKVGKQWGYIDTTGRFVIEPKFDFAGSFSEGLARVNIGGKWDVRVNAAIGGKWGFIDRNGKYVIPLREMRHAKAFSDGLAAFSLEGQIYSLPVNWQDKWGYMDKTGTVVIEPQFAKNGYFSCGLVHVSGSVAGCHGIIDKTGKLVIDLDARKWRGPVGIGMRITFREDLAAVEGVGYIDLNGRIAVALEADDMQNFSEGLAAVEVDGLWGYIDKTGNFVIKPQYYYAGSFSEGLAQVATTPPPMLTCRFINKRGEVVIKLEPYEQQPWTSPFSSVGEEDRPSLPGFHHGLALINYGGLGGIAYRYIDKQGNTVYKYDGYGR